MILLVGILIGRNYERLAAVKLIPVKSSSLRLVGYDAKKHRLTVVFRNGLVYEYASVPERLYNALMDAPSKGKFFNKYILGIYEFRKLEPDD